MEKKYDTREQWMRAAVDKINEEIALLVELKEQARTLIHMLTDERYKTVLTEYYLNHKT